LRKAHGDVDVALSALTVVELTHGIYRARTEADQEKRRLFVEGVLQSLIIHPVSVEIARLTGRIEGEQAAIGNVIPFEDLLIGATALHLGFELVTLNLRHFDRIPGLRTFSL
jgi:predicted nucleic acid-binding protein